MRSRLAWPAAAAAVSLVFAAPVVALLAGSLRGLGQPPPSTPELIPSAPSVEGYERAFEVVPLGRALLNSLALAAAFVPLAVLVAALTGFAIAQLPRRTRTVAVAATLLVLAVPISALWVPRFVGFRALGLEDTWVPLLAPALLGGSPLLVLLYFLAFRRLPPAVLDAARVEGAGPWRAFFTVALPLVRSTTIAVALLAFVFSWGNLVDALLYLQHEDEVTAPLAVRSLESLGRASLPIVLAGAVVVTAPVALGLAVALRFIAPRRGTGWLEG